MNIFKPPAVLPGNNCNNNDKPIWVDVKDSPDTGIEITICTFLAFELEGEFSADGLFDEIDDYIDLEFDTGYVFKGAFSAGIKLTVGSLAEPVQIELDPITAQLYMQADLAGSASVGLFSAELSGNALLDGEFTLGYCSTCNGVYPTDGFEQAGSGSSFYFNHRVGYDLDGELHLMAGIPGLGFGGTGLIGIQDDNVYDTIAPLIQLPEFQVYKDIMMFTPQNAVGEFLTLCPTFTGQTSYFNFTFFRYAAKNRYHACSSHDEQGF